MRRARQLHQLEPAAAVVQLDAARIVEEVAEPTRVPRFFSTKSTAARWDLSRMSVYRAFKAGRLRGYRVCGALRFREEDLLEFLRAEGVPIEGDCP